MADIEIISRGILLAGTRFLLCQNRTSGYFYLPGGHVEPGERIDDALARELGEELGWHVWPGDLVAVAECRFTQNGKPRHELNLVFHVEHEASAEVAPQSLESDIAFAWVLESDLESLDLRPRSLAQWLIRGSHRTAGVDWLPDA